MSARADYAYPLGLFEGFGIELEYMIVDRDSLSVAPISDRVIFEVAGAYESEVETGALAWSNELVLHVLEFKTNGPAPDLEPLAAEFHADVTRVNRILSRYGACLMPTAMHPWMDPLKETRLWPHESQQIYAAFDRVFDCRGHGWSNLQSIHINLPFRDDDEFGRLHAAVRMVLPILPALAASSPIVGGSSTGFLDTRLEYYRANCRRVPSVTGRVIPEALFTRQEYEDQLLGPIYRDIARFDPDGTLQHEWLNARGAIARFDRGTIEIRLLDIQESPLADLAVCAAVVAAVRAMEGEAFCPLVRQKSWPAERLQAILFDSIRYGHRTIIRDEDYLRDIGFIRDVPATGAEVWRRLLETCPGAPQGNSAAGEALDRILDEGCLAARILKAAGSQPTPDSIDRAYRSLCACLAGNALFPSSGE